VPYDSAPQVFHDKDDSPHSFVMYPTELFAHINNVFTPNEAKILLTLLGCKGDGSFSPSTKYMLHMTGITNANHYFVARKALIEDKYIDEYDGGLYVSTESIMAETKQGRKAKRQKAKANAHDLR
jgi:hypothetical protein